MRRNVPFLTGGKLRNYPDVSATWKCDTSASRYGVSRAPDPLKLTDELGQFPFGHVDAERDAETVDLQRRLKRLAIAHPFHTWNDWKAQKFDGGRIR